MLNLYLYGVVDSSVTRPDTVTCRVRVLVQTRPLRGHRPSLLLHPSLTAPQPLSSSPLHIACKGTSFHLLAYLFYLFNYSSPFSRSTANIMALNSRVRVRKFRSLLFQHPLIQLILIKLPARARIGPQRPKINGDENAVVNKHVRHQSGFGFGRVVSKIGPQRPAFGEAVKNASKEVSVPINSPWILQISSSCVSLPPFALVPRTQPSTICLDCENIYQGNNGCRC